MFGINLLDGHQELGEGDFAFEKVVKILAEFYQLLCASLNSSTSIAIGYFIKYVLHLGEMVGSRLV